MGSIFLTLLTVFRTQPPKVSTKNIVEKTGAIHPVGSLEEMSDFNATVALMVKQTAYQK